MRIVWTCVLTTLLCTCGRAQHEILRSKLTLPAFLENSSLRQDTLVDHTGLSLQYLASHTDHDALLVYCTGSLPVPLLFVENEKYYNTLPFPLSDLTSTHDVAVASKPGVPLAVAKADLNERFQVVDASGQFPRSYTDRNYLDYYVRTTNALLKHLTAGKKYRQVVVMGHSQGARVAAKVAATNPAVTHLVYLSGNPLGRYDQLIREKREAALAGQITDEEANAAIAQLYDRWRQINADAGSLDTRFGDSNKTWTSFSESTVGELLGLDIPLFVGYGTRDIVARYCDLLPLHFITAGKDDLLTLRAYPDYDHSFHPVAADGRADFSERGFLKVIEDVLSWLKLAK
ncbi:MAG: alpha/beta hydrolase [Bacteroidota bacterium]